MLARWFVDVSFQVTFLQIAVVLETYMVTFGAQNFHLACLVPPLWHPGGPWDDPGAPGSTRKETLGSRLGFLSILDESFSGTLDQNRCLFSCLFPGHFFK